MVMEDVHSWSTLMGTMNLQCVSTTAATVCLPLNVTPPTIKCKCTINLPKDDKEDKMPFRLMKSFVTDLKIILFDLAAGLQFISNESKKVKGGRKRSRGNQRENQELIALLKGGWFMNKASTVH